MNISKMKGLLLGTMLCAVGTSTFAQTASWNFNYVMAAPMGDTKSEWIEEFSFRGFSIDGHSFIDDQFSIGGSMGWQGFYEKREDQLVENGNSDIFGTQFRYLNTFNVSFDAHYYFGQPYSIRPYVGIAAGPSYVSQRGDLGLWSLLWEGWHFAFRGEAGVYVPFNNSDYGLNLGVKYNYILKRKESPYDHQWLAINVGLLHMI